MPGDVRIWGLASTGEENKEPWDACSAGARFSVSCLPCEILSCFLSLSPKASRSCLPVHFPWIFLLHCWYHLGSFHETASLRDLFAVKYTQHITEPLCVFPSPSPLSFNHTEGATEPHVLLLPLPSSGSYHRYYVLLECEGYLHWIFQLQVLLCSPRSILGIYLHFSISTVAEGPQATEVATGWLFRM